MSSEFKPYDEYARIPTVQNLSGGVRETIVTNPITGGQKGSKDVQLHALPWAALQALGRVYAFGSEKYEDYNFRKGYDWSLSFDALLRHLFAFWDGEDLDPESGLPHLAHAMWHAATLLSFMADHPELDDRFKPVQRDAFGEAVRKADLEIKNGLT